jgi:hypothetical protein
MCARHSIHVGSGPERRAVCTRKPPCLGGQGGTGAPWEALGGARYDDHTHGGIENDVTVTGRTIS